jgi:ligand-binding SRPBCC domain-containing protein
VFAFFLDAWNLEAITPRWLRFRLRTAAPIEIRRGSILDFALRLHGVPIAWRSEITALEPPYRFVDEQRRGPFRRWVHEHRFSALDAGRTLAEDRVEYAPRGGALANRLLVERDLRRIFAYRAARLQERFGAAGTDEPPAAPG